MNDGPADPKLYAIAELISRGVGTPTGLVTVLSGDRQVFAATWACHRIWRRAPECRAQERTPAIGKLVDDKFYALC